MEAEDVHAGTGYRGRRLKIIAFGPEEAGKVWSRTSLLALTNSLELLF